MKKVMVYSNNEDYLIGFDGTDFFLYAEKYFGEDIEWEEVEDVAFTQWIGLKDKNEVDIYEGDIIEYKPNNTIWESESMYFIVLFVPEKLSYMGVQLNYKYKKLLELPYTHKKIEVVDNIYEYTKRITAENKKEEQYE